MFSFQGVSEVPLYYTELSLFQGVVSELSLFQGVIIEEFHCICYFKG